MKIRLHPMAKLIDATRKAVRGNAGANVGVLPRELGESLAQFSPACPLRLGAIFNVGRRRTAAFAFLVASEVRGGIVAVLVRGR